MGQQLVEGDRSLGRRQPVDVPADRIVDRELPVHLQPQDRRTGELLGQRTDVEHRVGTVCCGTGAVGGAERADCAVARGVDRHDALESGLIDAAEQLVEQRGRFLFSWLVAPARDGEQDKQRSTLTRRCMTRP